MYTIIMDKYKNLNTTVRTTLFQQESMVDELQFLIPPKYQGKELAEYTVVLKYVDPNGNFHSETLELGEEMYKDYLRYSLPITTKLTQVAGTISLRLTLVNVKDVEGGKDVDKLETQSTSLIIQKPDGFNDYVDFEDIEAFKAQIESLNKEMADMYENLPNDLAIGENENLHLVHDDTQIGKGVEILLPTQFDELDDDKDGIFDLDNTPNPQHSNFIEL